MIERYSRPEMKQVWSDENKFQKWLKVEIAVCEGWSQIGVIPKKVMPKIRKAHYNYDRMMEILKET
jgi:adenylosuccinate lyase